MERPCSKCKSGKRQHNGWCSPCNKVAAKVYRESEKSKAWRKTYRENNPIVYANYRKKHKIKNPDYYIEVQLKSKYGISLAEKHLMIMEQRFQCAACEERLNPAKQANVDHCHKSKTIRGVLCSYCNLALGLMKDDPTKIRKLALYLERIRPKKKG